MHLDFLEGLKSQDGKTLMKDLSLITAYLSHKTPFGYINWVDIFKRTQPAFEIANKFREHYEKVGPPKAVPQDINAALLVAETLWNFVPPICIHENIIPALMQTDVKPIESPEYALPYFIFLLPKNFKSICGLPDYETRDLNFQAVFVACLPNYIGATFLSKDGICHGSYEWLDPFDLKNDICKEEDIILEKFIKNVILTFTYESKYVTDENVKPSTKGKGFNSSNATKPFQVRWLGKNYKQVRQRARNITDKDLTENKRFMRPHWRRGHWHTVCCGPKHKQRKQQWYKPVFIHVTSD